MKNHNNWIIEDWKKTLPNLMSLDFYCDMDGRARIWCKQHNSMDPSWLVSIVQAGGGAIVRRIFSWHTLRPLVPIKYCLNFATYLVFKAMVHLSCGNHFQQNNAPCHKSVVVRDRVMEHGKFSMLKWPPK